MAETPSDTDLLQAWRHGDTRAGEALFERHYDGIRRFFRSRTSGDPVDHVQRTFLACLEGRDRIRDDAAFRRYLYTAAHNILYKHYRDHKPHMNAERLSQCTRVDLGISPSRVVAHRQQRRLLLEALRSLPVGLQVAIELHYFEGFSGPDVAQILGVPHGTAKTRLRRARALLDTKLRELTESSELLRTTMSELEDWASAVGKRTEPRE